jgi:hypothetical protein
MPHPLKALSIVFHRYRDFLFLGFVDFHVSVSCPIAFFGQPHCLGTSYDAASEGPMSHQDLSSTLFFLESGEKVEESLGGLYKSTPNLSISAQIHNGFSDGYRKVWCV